MRTTALLAAIGIALMLAAPATAQNTNPVFNGGPSTPTTPNTDVPTDPPFNSPMNAPSSAPTNPPMETPSPPTQQQAPPPPARWNSAAAAIWRVRGVVHVAIGYSGIQESADDARMSAVKACQSAGGRGCKAIGAWNKGCIYITTGSGSNQAGWGSGGDIATALEKCRGYGFSCKQPIGGCVD
jgi:hypothetical protein